MKNTQIVFALISCALFLSCETTKLVYSSKTHPELNRLAVADLNRKNTKLDSVFPKLDSAFTSAAIKYSNRFLAKETVVLNKKISYDHPDSLGIIDLCVTNNLDAVVLSYVEFKHVASSFYYIPTNDYFECILYSKIYDKNGRLLYSVVHDSKDDSLDKSHDTYGVVSLSVGHSYKKIYTRKEKDN